MNVIFKGTLIDNLGYCRPGLNYYVSVLGSAYTVIGYFTFLINMVRLINEIKKYFKNKEDEIEGKRFIKKIKMYII